MKAEHRRFCSNRCSLLAVARQRAEAIRRSKPSCPQCGESIRIRGAVHCSRNCAHLTRKQIGPALIKPPVAERRAAGTGPDGGGPAGRRRHEMRGAGWQGPVEAKAWDCLAEGTLVWLPDGTVAPIERVVSEKLPVLAYDKAWDLRQPKAGRAYPPRDQGIGIIVPTAPVRWIDNGERPVFAVLFASGRVVEATANHRWAVRSREGSRRPVWCTTEDLRPGSAVPAPLAADFFGTLGDEWDGWFVGSMLGDGSMTGRTPTWVGHDDGNLQQLRDYATKHDCQVNVDDCGTWLRVRLTDPAWHRNALRDILIEHQIWGLKGEGKRVSAAPTRPQRLSTWLRKSAHRGGEQLADVATRIPSVGTASSPSPSQG